MMEQYRKLWRMLPMAEKKKILYIVEAMGGGVFTYIVDLANELVNSYDMYIAYAVRKQTPQNYKDYFDKRIHLIEVKNFGRVIDPAKDIAAFFEVKKIAAKIKPDVIHLHSSKAGAIGRVAFNGKIPMFYTPHGYSFLMENYKPMKRRMFKVIESVCAKRNCTTISCSVGEHQESLKLTKHATYVNNGINMAELQEIIDKTEKVEHPFTVYTLGRICYQKNPTLFNEIAESLPDVKFVWIGDGELRDQLTSENIEITGLKMFALPLLHVGGAIILYYPLLNFWTLRWGILFVYLIIVLIKERFRIGTLVPVLAEKCSFLFSKMIIGG